MEDKLKHIDSFYKQALENFTPQDKKPKGWTILWLKLLFLSLGINSLIAMSVILLSTVGIVTYVVLKDSAPETNEITKFEYRAVKGIYINKEFEEINAFSNEYSYPQILPRYFYKSANYQKVNKSNINENLINHYNAVYQKGKTKNLRKSEFPVANNPGHSKSIDSVSQAKALALISSIPERKSNISFEGSDLSGINKTYSYRDSLVKLGVNAIRTSLLLYVEPEVVFNKIKANNENQDIEDDITANFDPAIFVLNAGAEFRFQRKKWFLQSGLKYSTYGENANYNQTTEVLDPDKTTLSFDTTWRWIYDPPFTGEPRIYSIDSIYLPYYYDVTNTYSSKNRYHFIELPLVIGYQNFINQISYSVSTGISIGFIVNQKGSIPNISENKLENISTYTIKQPQFNYLFQIGLGIPVKENLQLYFEPTIKTSLTSMFDDPDYNFDHKYISVGIKAGFLIDF